MVFIFLAMIERFFLRRDIPFTLNELILSEKMTDSETVPRGEGGQWQLISIKFTFNFYSFLSLNPG